MALSKTEERIPARMPREVYERIATAARTIGATLTDPGLIAGFRN